jgi:hypothetical protein
VVTDVVLRPRLFEVQQERTTSDDYYTPAWVFERMGIEFDLDVCAPPDGIPWIPAKRYFTQADDGLAQPWHGRVWMNPPYSKPSPWVERFVAHGNGVTLLPFAKSAWFDELIDVVPALVALGVGGSKFVGGPIFQPCFVAAFGDECVEAIGNLGRVLR